MLFLFQRCRSGWNMYRTVREAGGNLLCLSLYERHILQAGSGILTERRLLNWAVHYNNSKEPFLSCGLWSRLRCHKSFAPGWTWRKYRRYEVLFSCFPEMPAVRTHFWPIFLRTWPDTAKFLPRKGQPV